jgi:hypothetical protein
LKYLIYLEERDWDKVTDQQADRAGAAYRKHLAGLRSRLSKQAWEYFWLGFAEKSIHDAHLISLSVGDGLVRLPKQFASNSIKIKAEFLNQNDKYRFIFTYRVIRKFSFEFDATLGAYFIDLATKKYFFNPNTYLERNRLDHVIGDELTGTGKKYLRHEVVFRSGARFVVIAEQISFSRKRNKS